MLLELTIVIIGALFIVLLAHLIISKSIHLSKHFNLSGTFVGMTILSIGTSLPEIMTHVIGSLQIIKNPQLLPGISALVIGTNIGSDIFSIKNLGRICGDVYNLGNDNLNTTKQDLVDKVCEITGATNSVDVTRSDPDKRDYLVSSEKLYNLGYQPYKSLEYGIRQMLNFYDLLSEGDREKCKNY